MAAGAAQERHRLAIYSSNIAESTDRIIETALNNPQAQIQAVFDKHVTTGAVTSSSTRMPYRDIHRGIPREEVLAYLKRDLASAKEVVVYELGRKTSQPTNVRPPAR